MKIILLTDIFFALTIVMIQVFNNITKYVGLYC